ncbi:hybrid sensor histidine kinase/response regulator [Nostoc sp. TCL26-01]|uniref:hybrid sensor histidine kinase/response regulator n=1 Tax=Nostoc sp. TCL26-01 TaxID=2576904 RepID=UPI0015BFC51B|nr:hybrid sensor histidine kinase/response regulator [Nostoc sp. TCL26-01]QLE57938.1 response regulator [Nostoc sp. TCL26-01]
MLDTWTLLIIDDCAADRKIYRRYLLKDPHQSYQIWEADCAAEAIALCQEKHFDVILLDICLPDMSGLELLDQLKQYMFTAPAPVGVIVLTGRGDEEIAVQAMKRGALDYLVKQQLKPDVLQPAVRNAIKQLWLQTQLNKTQERQRLIATTALRIRQSLNLEEILHTVVSEIQQLLKSDRLWRGVSHRVMVYQFTSDTSGKIVASSVDSSQIAGMCFCVTSPIDNSLQCICYEGDWGLGIGDKSIQNSKFKIQNEGRGQGDKEIILSPHPPLSPSPDPLSPIPHLVVPININNSGTTKLWGLLIAHHDSDTRQWQADDVEMLSEVSVQLAIAIQQAELLAKTQAALKKEQQLNALKSQIIATVSHEYRTPLTSILAAASTLVKHGQQLDESKQQKFMHIIEQKARYMSELVDSMLLVDQMDLAPAKFKPISLDLQQFFWELIEQEREVLGKNHEIIGKITGSITEFWGDRGLLQQIFVNLISNAVKYSPDGGTIEFHLIDQESQVIFHITDQGIGIPPGEQENLFQSLSRGSNVGTISGTGLGLAIAKACVDLHGGDINLSSQIGQGTTVTVSLPKQINTWGARVSPVEVSAE